MQINDEYIDDLFARKLGNMETAPPEDGWHRIEGELNRRTRITRRFWLGAASLALLLSVTASVIYLQTQEKPSDKIAAIQVDQQGKQQQPPEGQHPPQISVKTIEPSAPQATNRTSRPRQIAQPQVEAVPDITIAETIAPEPIQKPEQTTTVQVAATSLPATDSRSTATAIAADQVDIAATRSNTIVYTNSWDEIIKMQPLKTNRLELIAKSKALRLSENMNAKESTVATAQNNLPVYDEITFVDPEEYSSQKQQSQNRWKIAGQIAPVYSYRAITGVPSGMKKSDFDEAESGLLAYSGGLSVAYRVVGRLSVQTGVYYSQMGQTINSVSPVSSMYAAVSSNNSYTKNFVRTSSGSVIVASNMKADVNDPYANFFNAESQAASNNSVSAAKAVVPTQYSLIERIDYLEIPLILRYSIIDRRLNFYLLGGMSTNILIDNNVFMDNGTDVVKEGTLLKARPINYSSTFGLGLSYQMGRNLLIDIEPSFKYYLQPYTTNNQTTSNPYAFGVFTGITYLF